MVSGEDPLHAGAKGHSQATGAPRRYQYTPLTGDGDPIKLRRAGWQKDHGTLSESFNFGGWCISALEGCIVCDAT